jgi:hypothetical protein
MELTKYEPVYTQYPSLLGQVEFSDARVLDFRCPTVRQP